MAKQIEGVYERVLECAKKEFLEKGFKDASLRIIASEAGTTTGSIYTRFKDKAGLFQAIVEPAADGMKERFLKVNENFHQFDAGKQEELMGKYTSREMERILDYIYEHFDEFHLLLDASYGTKYQHFVDELARIEVEYTYKYIEAIGLEKQMAGVEMEMLLHLVMTSYFESLFEVIRHDLKKEEAKRYVTMLQRYHMAGFETLFL